MLTLHLSDYSAIDERADAEAAASEAGVAPLSDIRRDVGLKEPPSDVVIKVSPKEPVPEPEPGVRTTEPATTSTAEVKFKSGDMIEPLPPKSSIVAKKDAVDVRSGDMIEPLPPKISIVAKKDATEISSGDIIEPLPPKIDIEAMNDPLTDAITEIARGPLALFTKKDIQNIKAPPLCPSSCPPPPCPPSPCPLPPCPPKSCPPKPCPPKPCPQSYTR